MRALGQAVVLLLVVVAVPVAAGLVLGDAATASVTAVGAVYGVLLALRAGWRRALAVVPVLVVVSVAAALSAGSAWWVVVLGALGLAAGWSARWGLLPVLALVGAAAASAPPLPTDASVVLRFAWVAGAAAYAVVVARLLGLPAVVEGVRVPGRVATAGALLLGAVVALAAVLAQQWGARLAYWLPATVFLLVLPTPGVRWSRVARSRVLGTVAGVALGGALAAVVTTAPVRLGLAVVAAAVTVAVTRPVWANAAATTVTLMLVLDPGGTGLVVGEERLVATAAAAALVLAGGALLAWWAPRLVPASGDASLPVLRDVRDPVADEGRGAAP
ncbi:Fusaric acid resistance protein-like [Cellulosimicrobium cellulans J1]|nr:Fusaric acid resistance protein-like [Cellulosimicrobium cellulans J1]